MHKEIKDSGLGEMYKVRPMTDNVELAKFLGKRVAYKKELLTKEFIRLNGTICVDTVFTVKEVQIDYKGRDMLRGYTDGDTFGRIMNPAHLEIVGE